MKGQTMRESKYKCFVRNLAQKVLMEFELMGQMSDGYWENARQDWHLWCDTEFLVSPDGKLGTVGIDDWQKRQARYNLSAKALLDVVGERMIASVRVCHRFPKLAENRNIRHAVQSLAECGPVKPSDGDYRKEYVTKVEAVIGNANMAEFYKVASDESLYTMKQMRRDLNDLKAIMKLSIRE
jgi:hypothetical protein